MGLFASQLTKTRPAVLRTAHCRLKNPEWARDAASESLPADLEKKPDVVEQSRVRAWLFGILRNKVVDQLRHHLGQERSSIASDHSEIERHEFCDPCPRSDPRHQLVGRQFLTALKVQLERWPVLHADAFVKRECLGRDSAELCREGGISAGHLGVVLHRAPRRLRQILAHHGA